MFPYHFDYCYDRTLENPKNKNRLKVFGQGIVNAKPDMANITIGIITENRKLEIAQKENATLTKQVLDSIKSMGVSPKDIQTQNYSINMKYDYIEGKQVFSGYTVSNFLKVLIRDIINVGEVIDAAVNAGANAVDNINFVVSNTERYYSEALRLAIKDAQYKAMVMASKLKVNINIVPIQIVEQESNTSTPLIGSSKTFAAVTPIEVGENKIIAKIEAIFIYSE